ncbi:MAG: hypothetical protein JWQ63_3434 [Mucilaginibacter sp.]|nr:hypothetical protein [Mucilaginibacter sp.]
MTCKMRNYCDMTGKSFVPVFYVYSELNKYKTCEGFRYYSSHSKIKKSEIEHSKSEIHL